MLQLTLTLDALDLDLAASEKEIVEFIRKTVKAAGAEGVALGLSGGIDSAVVGALCVKALGKDKVVVLLMPSDFTPKADLDDARELARSWGVRVMTAKISAIADALFDSAGVEGTRIARANAQARIRMALNYYVANTLGLLVAGTGDRSEDLVGYFTKYGDGGVDFLPIAHLYKTQVRALGDHLGVPERIVTKPSSPQLWPGHKAADELPVDYDKLDLVLHCLFDSKMSPKEAARQAGVDPEAVKAVLSMHEKSAHKRSYPPMLRAW